MRRDDHDGVGRLSGPRRRARRSRSLLAGGLVAVLAWSALAFLNAAAVVSTDVQVIPGTAPDGRIAQLTSLADTVTRPNGSAQLRAGVKFYRIDVASAFANDFRVNLAWQNAPTFMSQMRTSGWQLRFGLYYPVRTGACDSNDDDGDHPLTLTLSAPESFSGSVETFCVYRDVNTAGPGVIASGDHAGTLLLAPNLLVGTQSPAIDMSGAAACTGTGTTPCRPAAMSSDQRAFFVIGSILNAAGNAQPGQQEELDGLEMFARVSKGGL